MTTTQSLYIEVCVYVPGTHILPPPSVKYSVLFLYILYIKQEKSTVYIYIYIIRFKKNLYFLKNTYGEFQVDPATTEEEEKKLSRSPTACVCVCRLYLEKCTAYI